MGKLGKENKTKLYQNLFYKHNTLVLEVNHHFSLQISAPLIHMQLSITLH